MRYTISTDPTKLDLEFIHSTLSTMYWYGGRTRSVLEAAIRGSLPFGVYKGDAQIGFARVITDYATFAYLADVFILEAHQGQGLGKRLVQDILTHPELATCGWMLFTKDAHSLYAQYGFEPPEQPERLMRRKSVEREPLVDQRN